ncbi:hypothetical protein [Caproiciproducens faecalis]|uniref:Uncharacterized protein n=1 Tax=Caproiciproducens faecalis TaxID=2820301 RepID=A0ABS7DRJ1_9FIRM|nr:hypothetical protein [Caproiciproducens faecalis]MBW7573927.1 hypothetical protein [Caproiciproducens faecalis]
MFTENSGLVAIWVQLIRAGTYTEDKVPALSNLQDIVHQVLNEEAAE